MGGFKKKLMINMMKKAQPTFRQRFQKPLNVNKTIHRYGPIIEAGIDSIYQKFQNVRSFSFKQKSLLLLL